MKKIAVGDIVRRGEGSRWWPASTPVGIVTEVEGRYCRIHWFDHGTPKARKIARNRNRRHHWWKWWGQAIRRADMRETPDLVTLLGALHKGAP